MSHDESLIRNISPIYPGDLVIPIKLIEKLKPKLSLVQAVCEFYYDKKRMTTETWHFLLKKGMCKKSDLSPYDIKKLICEKKSQRLCEDAKFQQACSWCSATTYRLHNHHFPLTKKQGGTETVEICAQCHDEYHFIDDNFYILSDEVIGWFEELEKEIKPFRRAK